MVDSTIPNLVAVVTPVGTDLLGVRQSGDSRDKKLTVTQLLSLAPGGGDVTKVGTPVDNQLGVWTGDGTIEGTTALAFDGSTFTMNLGGGDFRLTGKVELQGSNRPAVLNVSALPATVSFAPLGNSPGNGLGGQSTQVSLITGFKAGVLLTSLNSQILQSYETNEAVTAFAGGGQGSAVILGSSYNVLSVVATTGDSVKLPVVFESGDPATVIYIKNDGANAADVFPGSGDDLGAGVDTAVSLAAGESASFIGTASSTWTPWIVDTKGSGGAQISGTPANNQLGVWVNATDIEGDANWQVVGTALQGVLGSGPEMRNVAGVNIHPRKGDTDTGIASRGDNRLGLVAQGIDGIKLIGASSAVLQQHNTTVGLTAFAGGGQGSATQLNSSYSVISTVATTGDSVKFSTTLEVGVVNYVKNDGANAMDLFPAGGDDLGLGIGVAISVGAGKSVAFIGTVVGSVSTQFIFEEPAAGGDVFKVGTPANNEIGVWTGDGTIEGDSNFLLTGTQLILPSGTSAGLPELKIGSGQTGFFTGSATQLRVTINGTERFTITNDIIQGFLAGSGQLHNRVSTSTVPTFTPNTNDGDTGIGWTSSDILSLIAGAVEGLTIAESGGVITMTFRGDLQAAGGGGAGPMMRNVSASPSVPTLIPNQADPDTGLTRSGIDEVALVGGGLDVIRCGEVGGVETIGFYTTAAIAKQTGVAVSSAGIHAALVALGLIAA